MFWPFSSNIHSNWNEYCRNNYNLTINFESIDYDHIVDCNEDNTDTPIPINDSVENLDNSFDELKKLSLQGSMNLIKEDLKKLGIQHDYFFYETELVKKDLVNKNHNNN